MEKAAKINPMRILVAGYLLVTLAGAALLSLPLSSASGRPQSFLDALFVAASGISTSGLTVVDISTFYSRFGQIVLLCIFQIGGIGYMSFIIFFLYLTGYRTSIRLSRIAIDSLSGADMHILGRFFLFVVAATIICETCGAFFLGAEFGKNLPPDAAVFAGIFHSVSAFCTAGFSIFSDSLMHYRNNITVNLVINIISLIGATGFIVLFDLFLHLFPFYVKKRTYRMSLHSKIVLIFTPLIITLAALIIFFAEPWAGSMEPGEKIMAAVFQAVSASTTDGFNTVDIGSMSDTSKTVFLPLMFIGASPGSTGGGIKLSTMVVILLFLYHHLHGRDKNVTIFKRRLGENTMAKSVSVFIWFCLIIIIDLLLLLNTEKTEFLKLLFEITSALGNTGLSTGITPCLSPSGRLVITVTMFIGRVGPLGLGTSLLVKQTLPQVQFPEEEVFVA